MDTPVLVVNFKTYEKGSGKHAETLVKKCEKVSKETGKNIVLAVQNADIYRLSNFTELEVFAQHTDPENFGSNTGKDLVETIKFNGATGTLINHSEDNQDLKSIGKVVKKCRENGLTSIVCVDSLELAEKVDEFSPDFIAYEPEELIGGDVSVSEDKPEVVEKVVETVETEVLAGAGVKTGKDVKKVLELGGKGVLVASGIVKAEDVEKSLKDMVEPL